MREKKTTSHTLYIVSLFFGIYLGKKRETFGVKEREKKRETFTPFIKRSNKEERSQSVFLFFLHTTTRNSYYY